MGIEVKYIEKVQARIVGFVDCMNVGDCGWRIADWDRSCYVWKIVI